MEFDFWGLGLQALNAVILIWLLSRVFWRPIAGAISKRQAAAQALLDDAQATQAKADAALAEITQARAGIAQERAQRLAEASAEAQALKAAALAEAQAQAEALKTAARAEIAHQGARARRAQQNAAATLAVEIARKLLNRSRGPEIEATFVDILLQSIADLSAPDRKALASSKGGVTLISASDLAPETRARLGAALQQALGVGVQVTFQTDPALIAGLELHSAHFVLRNSWQADLAAILEEVQDGD